MGLGPIRCCPNRGAALRGSTVPPVRAHVSAETRHVRCKMISIDASGADKFIRGVGTPGLTLFHPTRQTNGRAAGELFHRLSPHTGQNTVW